LFEMRYRLSILVLVFIFVLPYVSFSAQISDPFPRASASYLVQVKGNTLWAHDPDRKLPLASITKIMTALIVLENCKIDEVVTVGKSVQGETGTKLGLRPGEKWKVLDLLKGALIYSGADACAALADHVAGSEEKFVEIMNRRAQELGLSNTHFQNPVGHDNEEHYSTANDIAKLAKKALTYPIFAEIVSHARDKIKVVNGKRTLIIKNKNEMFGHFDGVKGVKTGYTPEAGKCLVALAGRNGTEVLLVLLNSPRRWKIADEMMKKAFAAAAKTAQR
jgi:serine-type D-Ala-D-Ala carboxypeptidase (penicillin-binding protein 5/6)